MRSGARLWRTVGGDLERGARATWRYIDLSIDYRLNYVILIFLTARYLEAVSCQEGLNGYPYVRESQVGSSGQHRRLPRRRPRCVSASPSPRARRSSPASSPASSAASSSARSPDRRSASAGRRPAWPSSSSTPSPTLGSCETFLLAVVMAGVIQLVLGLRARRRDRLLLPVVGHQGHADRHRPDDHPQADPARRRLRRRPRGQPGLRRARRGEHGLGPRPHVRRHPAGRPGRRRCSRSPS